MLKIYNELKKHSFLLYYLTAKDFKLKYRRSILGVAWSVLNPFFMMIILSVVFSELFKVRGYSADTLFPPMPFPLYLILGQTMFNAFNEATTNCLTSVLNSASLIKKVYIPKYVFPVEKTMFSFVNYIVSLVAVALVMTYYVIKGEVMLSFWILLLPIVLILFFFFTMGIGLILSALSVFFRDIIHLYSVIILAWMYLTPIFYPENILPAWLLKLMKFNPMYLYTKFLRCITIWHTCPSLGIIIGCVVCAVISMVIGCFVFNKNQNKFILHI